MTAEPRRPTRDADDQAIEALCFFLDRLPAPDGSLAGTDADVVVAIEILVAANNPAASRVAQALRSAGVGLGSRSGLEATRGELWSAILRRRLQNKYERTPRFGAAPWKDLHFHLRRLINPGEGDKASAEYVARIWNANATTVSDSATRKAHSTAALEWIQTLMEGWKDFPGTDRKLAPSTTAIYQALENAVTRIAADFSDDKKVKDDTANSP